MDTVIQLRADLARLMQGGGDETFPDDILRMKRDLDNELARIGASLKPMHPGVQDSELARYFGLSGTSEPADESVLVALRSLEAVTAAYVKPEAEPA